MTEGALSRELSRELNAVAHFGRASEVKEAVVAASQAVEEERFVDALEHLGLAKRHAPRSPSIRELAGLVHYRLGHWREAARELAAYRRLSGKSDQDPVYADALRAVGNVDRALQVLRDLDPAEVTEEVYVEGLVVLGGLLRDAQRAEEAVDALRRGPLQPREVLPHHLRLWYALAEALEAAGRTSEAREWWDAIYAEDPAFFDVAHRRLGAKR
jgi:tetratricopeptide (TPR) repeat protein